MNRPRAVMVCAQVPARDAAQAGHKTAFKFLTELVQTHAVDLLIACKTADVPGPSRTLDDLHELAQSVRFVPMSRASRLIAVANGLRQGIAPRMASRLSGNLLSEFRELVAVASPTLIWLEFSQVFWLVEHVSLPVRTLLSAHDVQMQVVAGKSALERTSLLGLTYECERRFLSRATKVRVQSTKDAALLDSFFRLPASTIEVAEPALSGFLENLRRTADATDPWSILFWGAMGRPENAVAVIDFVKHDFAALRMRYPAIKLYIVGSSPTAEVRALASASITVTGFLEDPSVYFERCSLGIAPLTSGAGVKVKVLEMLRAGIPVVSTPIGAEGVHANELLTVVDRQDFVEAISRAWA